MKTFNLMGLPSLAFEQVIKKLETAKVIELTIASKRFKSRVQRFKLRLSALKWEYPYSIKIDSNEGSAKIEFFLVICPEIRRINGTLVRMASDYRDPSCAKLTVDQVYESFTCLAVMEDVTIHLLSICKVEKFDFKLRTKNYTRDIRSIFIWKYCQTFNVFDISDIQIPQLSLDEMTFLSRNIEAKTLHIEEIRTNFRFRETFKCEQLELTNPYFATPECLISDHYTKIKIQVWSNRLFYPVDVVLKNWMHGSYDKLERFYARAIIRENAWSASRKLEEMEQTPTSFSKEELQFRSKYWHPMDICVDIRRPIDGRLATILMDDKHVLLLVWHEENLKHVSKETKIKLRELKLIN